ncbi:MAG: L,D-transpeptidase family protein, partial [Myxococcota bacterium]
HPLHKLIKHRLVDHGLEAETRYHVAALRANLEKEIGTVAPLELPKADQAVLDELVEWVQYDGGSFEDVEAADARMWAALVGDVSPWPALKAALEQADTPPLEPEVAQRLAEIEAMLVDGIARYAWDMHFQNEHRFAAKLPARMKPRDRRRRVRSIMRSAVEEVLHEPKGVLGWMKTLVPAHPQYGRLIEALKRYRAMEAAGGWPTARPVTGLRRGLEHARVVGLKKRLAAEGYFPVQEEYTELFDEAAADAVTQYQETHQIKVTGAPHKVFWRSLAIDLQTRTQQILISLERWRESNILDPEGYFVFVNIADFHLELWRDGARQLRFKTVTGNTRWGCSIHNKRWIPINQTPIQSSAIKSMVVNPWWAVPDRIRTQEILPAVAKDPGYWDFHNFHCVRKVDGECVDVRQGAGKRNALGKLKFLFPSRYSTFLHDTPKKHFFGRPIRALSHGCVRLEKPVELAQELLKGDGQWEDAEWDRYFNAKHRHTYTLKTPVPIHIEYYTVRVDDEGRVHFLADIYEHDRYRMRGERFSPRRCTAAELEHAVNPYVDDGTD